MVTKELIKQFIRRTRLAQEAYRWVQDSNVITIDKRCFDHVVTLEGDKYLLSKDVASVRQVQSDYRFSDIREEDIVIDVGANIGGFSIPASRVSKHVYAVEPITVEELRKNVAMNNRSITVLETALGDGQAREIRWRSRRKSLSTMSLSEIKKRCGGCDFLKVDCEGGEWAIRPEELEGIRRIEMEVHAKKGLVPWLVRRKRLMSLMEKRLEEAGFTCEIETFGLEAYSTLAVGLVHARRQR